ncbi:MAG: hypothetical protein IPN29_06400 [Saprospiraceae bacterium]|nr:hypothetical protein [Saprospiraceae bacterium]
MKSLLLFCLIILPSWAYLQSFPKDAQVLEDVRKYHGNIATAQLQGEWKLEKEVGYQFSNLAKKVVAATTKSENGVSKSILGLAIYMRGGSNEQWHFSRFFITSTESHGQKLLTEGEIIDQTLAILRSNPERIFGNLSDIAWVYGVSFPKGLEYEISKRDGDYIYKSQLDFERKFVESIPFDGGLYRYQAPFEIYVRAVGSQLKVGGFSLGNAEHIKKTPMKEKDFNVLPTLQTKPFDELSGDSGPTAVTNSVDADKDKKSKLPKVKGLW